jgi:cell wall-associated NlpC family hydrolase
MSQGVELMLTREAVIARMHQVHKENGHLNCRLAVQLAVNEPALESLEKIAFEKIAIGDILAWRNYRHFALWLGEGQIVQVGGWGEPVTVEDYTKTLEYWDEPEAFYKHPLRS